MRNITDKLVEEIKRYTYYVQQFFFKKLAVNEIMWRNMVETEVKSDHITRLSKDAICMG